MTYILLGFLSIIQLVMSVGLYYKRNSKVSRYFLFFTSLLIIWTFTNIILDFSVSEPAFFQSISDRVLVLNWSNKLGFFFGSLTIVMLYRITRVFPLQLNETKVSSLVTIFSASVAFLSLFTFVSGSYTVNALNQEAYMYGPLSFIIAIVFLLVAIESSVTLLSVTRSKNVTKIVKQQAKTILFGLLLTATLAITIIVIVPSLTKQDTYIALGYYSPYIFTIVLFYSIVRQGFLDFKIIIARSLAYAMSIMVVGLIFAFIAFSIANRFLFINTKPTLSQELVYILLAVSLGLIFSPLKTTFDKLTRSIFFRDYYDTERFLNALGKELSEQKDFTNLLHNSLVLFSNTLKAISASLIVLDETQSEILKASSVNVKGRSMPNFISLGKFNRQLLTMKDELDVTTKNYRLMKKHDLDIVLRLGEQESITGYLLLTGKRGGNSYTAQDIKVLEIASKQLSVAIQNARYVNQIAEFNKTLQAEVKRATSKLEKSNEKLRHLDEAKDEFVSMASHQLRTPLTTIKGYLSMLSEGDAGEITKMQQKFVGEAFTATQRMVYLISDLLNVSRISTGKFVLNETTVDFAKIISEEVGQLNRSAETKDIKLEYKKPTNLPQLTLDKTKVSQVVMNFIDNALYYTPKKGKVVVELSENNNYIELTVTDNGIGVPKFEQHQLFTKFFRAENAREARPDGTGLGLYMAKKVIIAQGGSIIFESREGNGSTFGFRFPKSRVVASKNK